MNDFTKMGYDAAQRIAKRHANVGNACQFAAESIGHDVEAVVAWGSNDEINYVQLLKLQNRCGVDLSTIAQLETPQEQHKALALFAAGAMKFYHEHPDEN